MFRLLTLVSLLLVGAPSAFCEETPPSYTLEQLVARALEQTDILEAKQAAVRKAFWAKKQAAAWKNPSAGLDFGRKEEDGEPGPAYEVSLSQPFYFPGKRKLRYEAEEMDEKFAALSLEEKRLEIRYEVIRLAYAYVAKQSLIQHAEERVVRYRVMQKAMEGRPVTSPQAIAEKSIAENRLLLFQSDLLRLQSELEEAWAGLNLYLNFPNKVPVAAEWISSCAEFSLDQLLGKGNQNNYGLKKLKTEREKVSKRKKAARSEALPDFTLSGFFSREEAAGDEEQIGLGVGVDLPVWNRNQHLAKSLAAEEEEKQAELQFEKEVLKQNLASLWARYQKASAQLRLFPPSLIEKVDLEMTVLDGEFLKNRVDLLTYWEAESEAYEAHLAVLDSQVEWVNVATQILFLTAQQDFRIEDSHAE